MPEPLRADGSKSLEASGKKGVLTTALSIYLFIYLSVCLSICLSIYPHPSLSLSLPLFPSLFLSLSLSLSLEKGGQLNVYNAFPSDLLYSLLPPAVLVASFLLTPSGRLSHTC